MFIVIDGIDASGKSTQALRLVKCFEGERQTVCLRVHPSPDNFFGVKARQFLYSRGRKAHFASAVFYMADVIRSILLYSWRRYDHLIFVRYLMGTAYLPPPLHRVAFHFFSLLVPRPDAMFFLDVDPDEAFRRISGSRRSREMFESPDELRRVRGKGLSLALIGKWRIVDGGRPEGEVAEEIRRVLGI